MSQSPNKNVATKYRENQSKTAKIYDLVFFTNSKPTVFKNTSLGEIYFSLDEEKRYYLFGVLCLRDPMIQCLISKSKKSIVDFQKEINCLSKTTITRRKSNVKKLVELALGGTFEHLNQNIKF